MLQKTKQQQQTKHLIHIFALYWPCQTYQYSVHLFLFLFTISSFKFEQ